MIQVQADAHLSMHAVEAWQAMCLGEHADTLGEDQRDWLRQELERSIGLSTFAYCVSRTAPWIFAMDEVEGSSVFHDVSTAWENVVPTRCMWIAAQVSLLALHRRAYARALNDDPEQAYNDYHKLQQLIRDTERRVRLAPLQVRGADEFLAGLNAEAHHHIGELYRAQHAHKPALKHFEAATHQLDLLRRGHAVEDVLVNSRWNVELQISHGKACYEMGRHKEALFWYLHAWRAFLELLACETQNQTNTAEIRVALDWLESVKYEPELRKTEVSERLRPVIDQLDRITLVGEVGALAAEILLRLGHLLFVLNVGEPEGGIGNCAASDEREEAIAERIRGTLAFTCLLKASECDPHSTLVGADLHKARFRFNSSAKGVSSPEYSRQLELPALAPIAQHWPRGGDDYERLSRVAEYLMLKERVARFEAGDSKGDEDEPVTDGLIARDLLLNLFMSTDSINVRKSQIHRFLMKPPRQRALRSEIQAPEIEFICMRRYSSPFPLLPRPSAFRALGGGYMVRLYGAEEGGEDGEDAPFGIVVDPGVDFVENLYRSGYSLSDVRMIILTHDHVDHIGALDPLLSLLHVRTELLSKQRATAEEQAERSSIKVLTSRSVQQRYDQVKRLCNDEDPEAGEFQFVCFEDLKGEDGVLDARDQVFADFPSGFEIVAMCSELDPEARDGHNDLSGLPSHGLCFRARGGGPSLAITSDTPRPPAREDAEAYERWRERWAPALDADVLIVHLGSVPLTELRRIDSEGTPAGTGEDEPDEEQEELRRFQDQLQEADRHLEGRVEYAQWLRSSGDAAQGDSTAPLVGTVSPSWRPPRDHNYLSGLLAWARAYRRARAGSGGEGGGAGAVPERDGLFVIGELSEELATMRGKVASRLNDRIFEVAGQRERLELEAQNGNARGFPYALTADIGLHVCISSHEGPSSSRCEVLCTTCSLDSDRAPEERCHAAHDIFEVCVKGENEGIFYNCLEHDPARQEDPAFLEQLERFDIFGR